MAAQLGTVSTPSTYEGYESRYRQQAPGDCLQGCIGDNQNLKTRNCSEENRRVIWSLPELRQFITKKK